MPDQRPHNEAAGLLDEYLLDEEMAEARGVARRTQRAERQRGDGPPYVRDGKKIYYHVAGYREWLKARMKRPVRGRVAERHHAEAANAA
jgi:hypothetical protein